MLKMSPTSLSLVHLATGFGERVDTFFQGYGTTLNVQPGAFVRKLERQIVNTRDGQYQAYLRQKNSKREFLLKNNMIIFLIG